MFAGHVGVAVALGRVERRLNLGALVLAALLLDVVLWILVLAGVEHATIPADYAQRHYLLFDFPYSHGLAAAFAWSLLTGLATWHWLRPQRSWRVRAAFVAGLAVFSHFLLDALVHVPELPVLGATSAKLGLSLWTRMPLALGIEAAIALGGFAFFAAAAPWARGRLWALGCVVALVTALTVVGQTIAPAPPDTRTLAWSSLATVLLTAAIIAWLARVPAPGHSGGTPA
jgi:hypothetical protein